jgi:hypothetical protein
MRNSSLQSSTLTGALQCNAPHDPPFLEDSVPARLYRNGTEMGLLGLHSSVHDIYATDGSLEGGQMGAGVYIVKFGMALRCQVGRSSESRTSLPVETGASYLALEHGKDTRAPIFVLTDSANHLNLRVRLMTGLGLASTRLFTAPSMATLSGG